MTLSASTSTRDAFEAIPTGLVLFDSQDRFVLWNKYYVGSRVSSEIKVGMRDTKTHCGNLFLEA